MSSLSIPFRSSSTVTTFYEGLSSSSSIKTKSSLKIKLKKLEKSVSVSANVVSSISFGIKDSLLWVGQKNCKSSKIRKPEGDWLTETNSSVVGDFIFILNTDCMLKKLDANVNQSFS